MGLPDLQSFTAIDFETATSYRNSACALGIVHVESGVIVDEFVTLIQPPGNEFWPDNIRVHGIRPAQTRNAPDFAEAWEQILPRLKGPVLVAHNAGFDRAVLYHSASHYGIDAELLFPKSTWFCTMQHYRSKGYQSCGLAAICLRHEIELNHHEALSDARACARLTILATRSSQ